jgi:C-terminal processing protease CtpA/Prc
VIQTGAAAVLLGAALLATSGARAADVERDDNIARPVAPAPAAPAAPPAPPAPVAGSPQRSAETAEARAKAAEQREANRAKREEKLREAQERLNQAASDVAALAAERAAEAVEGIQSWADGNPRRSVIGVQLSSDYRGEGAKVEDVSPGGPAESAGVRAGDLIVRVNGQEIKGGGSRQVVQLLREVRPDSKVKLRVERDGKERDIEVVARAFSPGVFVYRNEPPPGVPDSGRFGQFNFQFGPRTELRGLEVTTLTPQLGRYFGTSKGVLVVRAPSDDTLKLQDGDVILAIDGREPTSSSHIARILGSYQPGEKLTLRVMRDQKVQDVVVTLLDRPSGRERTRTTWLNGTMM